MNQTDHKMHILEDHDRGLAFDLATIERNVIDRRRAIAMFASAGTVGLLVGCGSNATATSARTAASTSSSSTISSTSGGHPGTCIANPAETAGPYPGDGSHTAPGSTSNVLALTHAVRRDIRSSFINTKTTAAGVRVDVTLSVVTADSACAPLVGYAVYLWHCDALGQYSLYDLPSESYLRGVQVTNTSGQVTFTTVFPGCYTSRFPHMHFEVFSSLSNATAGRFAVLTSQLAMPAAACNAVYATSAYTSSASRFASLSTSGDGVFGDNSATQIAAMTATINTSNSAGYAATAIIGVAT